MVTSFRGSGLPQTARLAGYSFIIEAFDLAVPTPPRLAAIAGHHRPKRTDRWHILPERYAPDESLAAQTSFAFKWEGVNLSVLDALFRKIPAELVADAVLTAPTGIYARRLWFFYEWLLDTPLTLSDIGKIKAVNAIDPDQQIALEKGKISARHKVRNNVPGTREYCPLVWRTDAIKAHQAGNPAARANAVIARTPADVLMRATAFMLLSDSRASFRIEGEEPSQNRAIRWGQAIARAGNTALSVEELETLQRIVVGDARFVKLGLRTEGGFVGEHDRHTGAPLPDHVSAKHQDLPLLMQGLVSYDQVAGRGQLDPVAAAAVEAFGFVYIHPFEDGNGRIHRWLIHHILAASGFAPKGIAFPISAVMLREIDGYRRVLESYSKPLLEQIRWTATGNGNVAVLNDTASWYRFFDATAHAEFLYHCVDTTITRDLPEEIAHLEAYDQFVETVTLLVDMPARRIALLHRLLGQNEGRLSNRKRDAEFGTLTDEEVAQIERIYLSSALKRNDSQG